MKLLLSGKPIKTVPYARWLNPILTELKVLCQAPIVLLITPMTPHSCTGFIIEQRRYKLKITISSWRGKTSLLIQRLGTSLSEDLRVGDTDLFTEEYSDHFSSIGAIVNKIKEYLINPLTSTDDCSLFTVSAAPTQSTNCYGGKIIETTDSEIVLESGLSFPLQVVECYNQIVGKYLIFSKSGQSKLLCENEFRQHFVLV